MDNANQPNSIKTLYDQAGVKVSCSLGSLNSNTNFNLNQFIERLKAMHATGALLAIESCNEPNNWSLKYQDEVGGGQNTTWLPVAKLQRDLYIAVKNDPDLQQYPVWSTTAGAEYDNVGLQFLEIPERAVQQGVLMPAGTRYGDFANSHNYFIHSNWMPRNNNQTWWSSEPTSLGKGECMYGNYGRTWAHGYEGYTDEEIRAVPRITTETGTNIDGYHITEEIQGLMYLSCYLSQYKQGWTHTAMYILRDRSDESGNQTFGFYQTNYQPRISAHYLHNMTTILADNQSIQSPETLTYSLERLPESPNPTSETVHDLLLQKNDGTKILIVWGERYQRQSKNDEMKVSFDQSYSVNVYNPAQYDAADLETGVRPIKTYQNTQNILLSVLNRPFILELGAPSGEPDDPTSIRDIPVKQTLAVYPNPVRDKLYVESDMSIQKVELFDLTGKNIFSRASLTSGHHTISTASLSKGVYVLRITGENNQVETHKIIK
jgi:hypothetical protein